jgi:hypothetical protein
LVWVLEKLEKPKGGKEMKRNKNRFFLLILLRRIK